VSLTPVQFVGDEPTARVEIDAASYEFEAGATTPVPEAVAVALSGHPDFVVGAPVQIPDGEPSTAWTKAQLHAALEAADIAYDPKAKNAALLDLLKPPPPDAATTDTAGNGTTEE